VFCLDPRKNSLHYGVDEWGSLININKHGIFLARVTHRTLPRQLILSGNLSSMFFLLPLKVLVLGHTLLPTTTSGRCLARLRFSPCLLTVPTTALLTSTLARRSFQGTVPGWVSGLSCVQLGFCLSPICEQE